MVKEAGSYAVEDKKQKELIEIINQADSLVYTATKTLKEHGDKVGEADKKNIQDKIDALDKLIKTDSKNKESIQKAMEELQQAAHGLAQIIYQQTQQQGSGEQQAQSAQDSDKKEDRDNVVDAEYKEVDGKDNQK
jgi:molecular chaperone DnaK